MSSEDFRQIARRGETDRPDRLFRAAVNAFCSLVRPTRRDALQLEQLALPLYDRVSPRAKRYVAAALSESAYAPAGLVRCLCEDSADIAAPLLVRSQVLTDPDLVELIRRHGTAYARIISRRSGLNPAVLSLVESMFSPVAAGPQEAQQTAPEAEKSRPALTPVERVRQDLRLMMQPADLQTDFWFFDSGFEGPQAAERNFQSLRKAILRCGPRFASAGELAHSGRYDEMLSALKSQGVSEEKALLVVFAAFPGRFPSLHSVRCFLDAYRRLPGQAQRGDVKAC